MSNSIEFEIDGEDYIVKDASSVRSWIEGLDSFIQDKANEHYTFAFEDEGESYEISKDMQRKIAAGVSMAMVKHREDALKPEDPENPRETWEWRVRYALRKELGLEDFSHECPQDQALDNSGFSSFRSELDDITEFHEGELADLDDVFQEVYSEITAKMQDLDTTTELNTYGKAGIKFIFVPGLHPKLSIDDMTIYLDDIQSLDVESNGFDALMRLSGVDALDLMEALDIDHTETDLVEKWVKYSSRPIPSKPLIPITSADDFNLIGLIDNAGVRYATPMWIGELCINDLINIDPLKPIFLTGGNVGLNDWDNGAGFVMEIPGSGHIELSRSELIYREYGYEMGCERGKISNSRPSPKKKPSLVFDDSPCP